MKLIALNTIGLTGVEIFQAYLAELDDVLVLPGQNFTLHGQNLYRPHDYSALSGPEVFGILSRELLTKAGRVWMGLTKYMDNATRDSYSRDCHRELFLARIGDRRTFVDCVAVYGDTYFESIAQPDFTKTKSLAFYSSNVALNLRAYTSRGERAPFRILNVENSIDYWLASISQTRTWDCIAACKFWIVNSLYLLHFQSSHPEYRSFKVESLIDKPELELKRICAFLDVSQKPSTRVAKGLIKPSRHMIGATRENAALLRQIYSDEALFKLADTLDQWGQKFLSLPFVPALLDRFAEFWNSTSHTNLDWVGPIAEEIIDLALQHHGTDGTRNLNTRFYHDYFQVHSDSHNRVDARLHHFLGNIELEIVVPLLPYHLKVAIEYLSSISKNYVFHSHSYVPVRQSVIYRRLIEPLAIEKLATFGLTSNMVALEKLIDEADRACAYLRNSA